MDALARQLDAFMQGLMERADPAIVRALTEGMQALTAAGTGAGAPREGDVAPDFALPDQTGAVVRLRELLATGPVVLTFFRGGWCPFCSLALRALSDMRAQLQRSGAEVVAISPQTALNAQETASRNRLKFPVLVDHGNGVARQYGLVWELDATMRAVYQKLGHVLPQINGTDEWTLPVPAGFVIAPDGRIVYAHVDIRPQRRLEPEAALAAVKRLKKTVAAEAGR